MFRTIAISLLTTLLAGCGYNKFDNVEPHPPVPQLRNADIYVLRELYTGSPVVINEQIVVSGTVTTSDRANNFYRSLFIQDATGALELRAGLYDMHNIYPAGQLVTLKLTGLVVAKESGVMQVGVKPLPSSYYPTEYMGQRAVVDVYLARKGVYAPLDPTEFAIAQLHESACGRLVKVVGLHYAGATGTSSPDAAQVTWGIPASAPSVPPATGYRKFKNTDGDSLLVVTSGYADFSSAIIPRQELSIVGILMYGSAPGTNGRSMYMIKPREFSDIR